MKDSKKKALDKVKHFKRPAGLEKGMPWVKSVETDKVKKGVDYVELAKKAQSKGYKRNLSSREIQGLKKEPFKLRHSDRKDIRWGESNAALKHRHDK